MVCGKDNPGEDMNYLILIGWFLSGILGFFLILCAYKSYCGNVTLGDFILNSLGILAGPAAIFMGIVCLIDGFVNKHSSCDKKIW